MPGPPRTAAQHGLCLLAALWLGACATSQPVAPSPVAGVWRVVEIRVDAPPAGQADPPGARLRSTTTPLPSQFIFTARHYSAVWMPGQEALRAFTVRWAPTDEEKLRRFGEVTVNTGTYEFTGDTIKLHPLVARMPEFMGGSMTYGSELTGNRLVLTFLEEYTFDGEPAPWMAHSAGHIHLVLERVDDQP